MRLKTALVMGLLLAFTAACGGEDDDGVATAGEATEDASVEAGAPAPRTTSKRPWRTRSA